MKSKNKIFVRKIAGISKIAEWKSFGFRKFWWFRKFWRFPKFLRISQILENFWNSSRFPKFFRISKISKDFYSVATRKFETWKTFYKFWKSPKVPFSFYWNRKISGDFLGPKIWPKPILLLHKWISFRIRLPVFKRHPNNSRGQIQQIVIILRAAAPEVPRKKILRLFKIFWDFYKNMASRYKKFLNFQKFQQFLFLKFQFIYLFFIYSISGVDFYLFILVQF